VDYSRLSDPAVVVPIKSFGGNPPIFSRDHYKAGLTIKIPLYEGDCMWTRGFLVEFSKTMTGVNLRVTSQDAIANVSKVFNRTLYLKNLGLCSLRFIL
jgi:hypothetical protein